MNRTRRLFATAAVGAFLLVGIAACGSSGGSEAATDDPAETTAADTGDTATDDTTAEEPDDGATDEADCDATSDSNYLSGDSVVLFSADQSELSEADLTDEDIATLSVDGALDPSEIQIGAGEMFGIEAAADAGLDGVIIGCAGGQTLVPGTAIGFIITEPGTYPISLDIAGTEIGTVVVS